MSFKNGLGTRNNSPIIWYKFRLDGIPYEGSCHTTNRADARLIRDEKRREASLAAGGVKDTPITVRQAFEGWSREVRAKRSAKHLQAAGWAIKVLEAVAGQECRTLSTGRIEELRAAILGTGKAPSTANSALRYLKIWLRWAVEGKRLKAMPCRIEIVKVQRRRRPVIAPEDVKAFLERIDRATQSRDKRVAVRCIIGLGLRESEVRTMDWAWFEIEGDAWTYHPGLTKSKKTRSIPVPLWLVKILKPRKGRAKAGLLFPARDGLPHRPKWLDPNIKAAAGFGPHRLRATFATLHAWRGTPLTEIQEMLGHEDIETTRIYVEDSLQVRRASQDSLGEELGLGDESGHIVDRRSKCVRKPNTGAGCQPMP